MLQQAIDVLAMGAIGALVAGGVGVVWSVRRLLPLQVAGMAALAGAGTYVLTTNWPAQPWVALLVAVAVSLPIALGLDLLIDRPLRRRPPTDALLASAGGLALLVGVSMNVLPLQGYVPEPHYFEHLDTLRHLDLITLALSALLLAALTLATKYFKLGLAMRAVGYHPDTASLMGINPDRIILWSVAIGSLLIATAGGLWSLHHSPHNQPVLLLEPVVIGLAGAVIGGAKRLRWSLLAGGAIGCIEGLAAREWPWPNDIRLAVPLVCLILFFLVRPPERVSIDAAEAA